MCSGGRPRGQATGHGELALLDSGGSLGGQSVAELQRRIEPVFLERGVLRLAGAQRANPPATLVVFDQANGYASGVRHQPEVEQALRNRRGTLRWARLEVPGRTGRASGTRCGRSRWRGRLRRPLARRSGPKGAGFGAGGGGGPRGVEVLEVKKLWTMPLEWNGREWAALACHAPRAWWGLRSRPGRLRGSRCPVATMPKLFRPGPPASRPRAAAPHLWAPLVQPERSLTL